MKKIISVLLCVVMLLGMLPILPTSAEAEGADLSGIADGGKYVDDKGNEYTVLKSADTILNLVKADMSGNFILGNDIDFNNKRFYSYMFNNDGEAFSGVFDGNGYAIKNFYTTANFNAKVGLLFGGLTGDARIQNLTVGGEGENIPFSIKVAKKTRALMYQNIGLAFASSALMITLSGFGVITALAGAFLHNVGAFIILMNSARLLRVNDEE